MHSNQRNSWRSFLSLYVYKEFSLNLVKSLKLGGFCIILLVFGLSMGYFTMLSSLFEQILCPKGYLVQFAGLRGSLLIVGGLVFLYP